MHLFGGQTPKQTSNTYYNGPGNDEFQEFDVQGSLNIGKKMSQVQNQANAGGPSRFNRSYILDFRLNFELPPGMKLCLFGKIPEMSSWDKSKPHCFMKPVPGERNEWMLEKPIITNQFYFTYKYAICDGNGNHQNFERGIDRIADLEILQGDDEMISNGNSAYPLTAQGKGHTHGKYHQSQPVQQYMKRCYLEHDWESFNVTFSVSWPIDQPLSSVTWHGREDKGAIMMTKLKSSKWMIPKYGDYSTPYEITMKMPNIQGGVNAVWKADADANTYHYNFSRKCEMKGEYEMERFPKRKFQILNANDYQGTLGLEGSPYWTNTDQVNVVNGDVQKADGNFLGLFRYSEIGETGITLGTYPSGHQDIQTIAESGAKAVLCIMTHDDFKQRGVDWNNLQNQYRQKGIEAYHEPISDDLTPQYADGLFRGAIKLNQLKKQYKEEEIFVHCTAGVSRGPTLMIVYMALFIKNRRWRSVEDLYEYLEDIYRWQDANKEIAIQVIESRQGRELQQQQYLLYLEEQERKKKENEGHTAEQEAELLRLQRLKHKTDEDNRLAKVNEEKRIRDKRMRDKEAEDNRNRDEWRNKLLAEIKAEEDRLARLKRELIERQRKIQQQREEAEERKRKRRIEEEEAERQRAINLEKLRAQLEYEERFHDEEKEKYFILKEIEIEQLELYERYHVEKTMQAEEYQKRLKELLIKSEEHETVVLVARKKYKIDEQSRIKGSQAAHEEAERLRREAAKIEADEREKARVIAEEEEREANRLRLVAEEEAETLINRLKIIEEQESERQRRRQQAESLRQTEFERMWREQYAELYNDQFGVGLDDSMTTTNYEEDLMGMSEEEIDKHCIEYFTESPIQFKARPGEPIDELMVNYIHEMRITIPIVWIKGNLYLIGSQRIQCEIRRNCLLLRVGGGYESFQEYVIKNDRYFQRMLIIYMIKSGESLEYVVECLINDRKIKNVNVDSSAVTFPRGRRSQSPGLRNDRSSLISNGVSNRKGATPTRSTRALKRKLFDQIHDTSRIQSNFGSKVTLQSASQSKVSIMTTSEQVTEKF